MKRFAVLSLVLAFAAPVLADGAKPKKPRLDLRASPRMSFSPAHILLTAELMGGDDIEDLHCPELEWERDDGGKSVQEADCKPFEPGVTKIERDHMKYLGDTLELIACEKAGIAKPGAPFVIGERDPGLVEVLRREARRAIARTDGRARADVRVLPADYELDGPLTLAGPHQRRNAAVAHGILAALPQRYRPGRSGWRISHACRQYFI
jgi:hypothetical protein